MKKRQFFDEIQFIRAIACLLVVLVHVTSINIKEYGTSDYFNFLLNQFSRLGTPVFAVISAFLLFNSVKERGFQFKKFIFSRTSKIVTPFIIWTIIYIAISKWYLGQEMPTSIFTFIYTKLILGDGFYHLYFISTVIQFYLIFPILQMIRNKTGIFFAFIVSLPVNYMSLQLNTYDLNIGIIDDVITNRSFILNWISYFLFGALLAYYYEEIYVFTKKRIIVMTSLFTLILIGIFFEINPYKIFTASRPLNMIYIPMFILFLMSIYKFVANRANRVFDLIGKYSMGIYLTHPLILVVLYKILPNNFWTSQLILVTYILTIILTVTLVKLISYLPVSKYIVPVPTSKKNKLLKGSYDLQMR